MFEIELDLQESIEIEDFEIGVEKVYPVLKDLTITPSKEEQTFNHPNSYGYDKVTVLAAEVKEDLTTELTEQNSLITTQKVSLEDVKQALQGKIGGEVLLQEKTIEPIMDQQEVKADSGYIGLSKVIVEAVDSSIDSDIIPNNIRKGIEILGVEGTLQEGITPDGELPITENGTYDVTNYASVNVNVESSGEDTTIEDGIVDGSLTGVYTNNRIRIVAGHKFRSAKISVFNSTSVETISSYSFYQSTALKECNTPNLKNLTAGNGFYGCTGLTRLTFPVLNAVLGSGSFTGCSSLEYLNLGTVPSIGSSAMQNTSKLKAMVLTRTTITALNHVNALSGSGIANGTGYVYVPDDLVESYKTATNWSTYASQIKPLSELPEEV